MADQLPTIRVIGFRSEYKPGKDGKTRVIEWVKFAPVSAIMTNNTEERVDFLRPPDNLENDDDGKKMAFMRHRWSMIEPAYEAWKKGQEIPVSGTPLEAWTALTEQQAKALQRAGLRTVEEVADLTDTSISKLQIPKPRDIVKQAKAFLETTERAVAASRIEELEAKLAEQSEQLSAAMALLEEQTKGKRGPGRPAKEKQENEAA